MGLVEGPGLRVEGLRLERAAPRTQLAQSRHRRLTYSFLFRAPAAVPPGPSPASLGFAEGFSPVPMPARHASSKNPPDPCCCSAVVGSAFASFGTSFIRPTLNPKPLNPIPPNPKP